jgi:hypothetical protein
MSCNDCDFRSTLHCKLELLSQSLDMPHCTTDLPRMIQWCSSYISNAALLHKLHGKLQTFASATRRLIHPLQLCCLCASDTVCSHASQTGCPEPNRAVTALPSKRLGQPSRNPLSRLKTRQTFAETSI